ncbi:MFS transporter [Picrophilus oshimae]|uniref:Major Facilitator Superfamily protein n=1 Tax=Picrophilus torridus (strain ATCC 700027 / DSM 9790 / JCM 10055 / NBRC 100828 / KAW 2/3) TaxID=1122961 RepID=A0A8G2L861_PICTO|nr:MFS transporter [Picrophilus oshimae]SMD31079.1 Major Facilitator Superfamily protein [Picrophilus oshimae DSM 9789]
MNKDARTIFASNFATAILGFGIFIATYDIAAISISILVLERTWHISKFLAGFLGASTLIGAAFGALIGGHMADLFGRRGLLIYDFIGYFLASILSAVSINYWMLFTFRFFIGLTIGADYAIVFPYISEMRPKNRVNRDMAIVMLAANFGMIIAYGSGGLFLGLGNYGWRYVLALGGFIALPAIFLRYKILESGHWRRLKKLPFRSFSDHEKRSIVFSSAAWFAYQVGDQGLSIFLPTIMAFILGFGFVNSSYYSLIVKAVTIPAALLTVYTIDKLGKKFLQAYGFLGRSIALLSLGFIIIYGLDIRYYGIVLLLLAYFFGAAGPDKTVVISPVENFRYEVRCTGEGISESFGRIGGIFGVLVFGFLATYTGIGPGILVFGILDLFGFIISALFMSGTIKYREYINNVKT